MTTKSSLENLPPMIRQLPVPRTVRNPFGLIKMGRHRPPIRCKLQLGNYLRPAKSLLENLPPNTSYSTKADEALGQIYLNDSLGDCVIAAGCHVVGVETGNAGNLMLATAQEVVADYSAIGGYVPGNPATDNGCDEQTAFAYWMQHGFFDSTKLSGYVAVDTNDVLLCKAAIYHFENLFLGIELPSAFISPPPSESGFVWDVAGPPIATNGHAVAVVDYNETGVVIATWGMLGTMTWAALAKYCSAPTGEAYVLITSDELSKTVDAAPNGLDWAQLVADFAAMGGVVASPPDPIPPPPPAPVPSPAPPLMSISVSDAVAWATKGLQDNWPAQVSNALAVGVGLEKSIRGANASPPSVPPITLDQVLVWVNDIPEHLKNTRICEVYRRAVHAAIMKNWPQDK